MCREIGHRTGESVMLGNLGLAALLERRPAEALGLFRAALLIDRELDYAEGLIYGLVGSAAALSATDGAPEAAMLLGAAHAAARATAVELEPLELEVQAQATETLKEALGVEQFAQAHASGQTLSLEDAVGHACAPPRLKRSLKRLTSALLDPGRRVQGKSKEMKMKKLGSIACLALAIALLASPVAEGASPVRGLWSGSETKYWTGAKWARYQMVVPFSFGLEHGKVVRFRTSSSYKWPGCTGGETVSAKLPTIRKAKVRHGQFRGRRTTHVGSRKMTMYVSGRFASTRGARGSIVVKLAGLPELPVGVDRGARGCRRHPHSDLPWAEHPDARRDVLLQPLRLHRREVVARGRPARRWQPGCA